MTCTLKAFDMLPCEVEVFVINGVKADEMDFGEITIEHDEHYGCCIDFKENPPTTEVLAKYNIDKQEYEEILDILSSEFFGSCHCCA